MSAPCEPWVTADEVAACCSAFTGGTDTEALEIHAEVASNVLSELSGGKFLGECGPITVRPCASACSCWGRIYTRIGSSPTTTIVEWNAGTGYWSCDGRSCGCDPVSEVWLDGYPREIVEVRIDGAVVPADQYRLDTLGRLVRLRDPAEPAARRLWPSCQIIDLDDTQQGTFAIDYTFGVDPPAEAVKAAEQLACQLWQACNNDGRCKLPANTRRAVRGGLTIEMGALVASSLKQGATGILAIDQFIAAHGEKHYGESTVWSPDLEPYPRRMLDSPGT